MSQEADGPPAPTGAVERFLRLTVDEPLPTGTIGTTVEIGVRLVNIADHPIGIVYSPAARLDVVREVDGTVMTDRDGFSTLSAIDADLEPGEARNLTGFVVLRYGREAGVSRPWRPGNHLLTASVRVGIRQPADWRYLDGTLATEPSRLAVLPRAEG